MRHARFRFCHRGEYCLSFPAFQKNAGSLNASPLMALANLGPTRLKTLPNSLIVLIDSFHNGNTPEHFPLSANASIRLSWQLTRLGTHGVMVSTAFALGLAADSPMGET
jgi:hypothetical protein